MKFALLLLAVVSTSHAATISTSTLCRVSDNFEFPINTLAETTDPHHCTLEHLGARIEASANAELNVTPDAVDVLAEVFLMARNGDYPGAGGGLVTSYALAAGWVWMTGAVSTVGDARPGLLQYTISISGTHGDQGRALPLMTDPVVASCGPDDGGFFRCAVNGVFPISPGTYSGEIPVTLGAEIPINLRIDGGGAGRQIGGGDAGAYLSARFTFSETDGTAVQIVPEPSTFLLAGLSLLAAAPLCRFRKAF